MGELTVKLGQLITIENKERKKFENEKYVSLQVEEEDGSNERCILFTEKEVNTFKEIDSKNKWMYNSLKAGRLYPFYQNDQLASFFVKIFDENEEIKFVKIAAKIIKAADERAKKNPEDLTKKSFFRNLID